MLKKKLCVTIHKGIRIEIEFKEISNNIEQKFAFQMKRKFVFSKLQNCEPETFQIWNKKKTTKNQSFNKIFMLLSEFLKEQKKKCSQQ